MRRDTRWSPSCVRRRTACPRSRSFHVGSLRSATQQQPTEDRYLLTCVELLDWLEVMLGARGRGVRGRRRLHGRARRSPARHRPRPRNGDALRHGGRAGARDVRAAAASALSGRYHTSAIREYSDETARSVDVEVRTLLEAAHERARATLAHHEEALRALARRLIEKEVVDRVELATVLNDLKPRRWSLHALDSARAPDGAARFPSVLTPPAPSQR